MTGDQARGSLRFPVTSQAEIFLDPAVHEHQDSVRPGRHLGVMGDHDEGRPRGMHFAEQVEYLQRGG